MFHESFKKMLDWYFMKYSKRKISQYILPLTRFRAKCQFVVLKPTFKDF